MADNAMTAKQWVAEKARLKKQETDVQSALDKLEQPRFLVCGQQLGSLLERVTGTPFFRLNECKLSSHDRAALVQFIHDVWPEDFKAAMEDPDWKSPRIEWLQED